MDMTQIIPILTGSIQELNELVQKLIKRIEILENNVVINKE